jgi:hypothetical protein
MRIVLFLGALALLLGIFGLVHHYAITGLWFQWSQFWHHEPLVAIAFCVGVALITTSFIGRRGIHRSR